VDLPPWGYYVFDLAAADFHAQFPIPEAQHSQAPVTVNR